MNEICCFFFCILPGAQLSEYSKLCHVERTTEVVLIYSACCIISISDRGLTRGAVRHVGGVGRRSDSGVTVGGGPWDAILYPLYTSVNLVFTFKKRCTIAEYTYCNFNPTHSLATSRDTSIYTLIYPPSAPLPR